SLHNPFDRIKAHGTSSSMRVDFPPPFWIVTISALGIYRNHHTLASERLSAFANQLRTLDGRSIQRNLIRAGTQYRANVFHGTQTAPDGKWDEDFVSDASHQGSDDDSLVGRGSDIQKRQFVRAFSVITFGLCQRIPGINQRDKLNSFDHAALIDIETWN